jgi:hypothetical protein
MPNKMLECKVVTYGSVHRLIIKLRGSGSWILLRPSVKEERTEGLSAGILVELAPELDCSTPGPEEQLYTKPSSSTIQDDSKP